MKDIPKGRRYTDNANSARIDELSENFSEFTKALEENTKQLNDLVDQMKKANDSGLQEILQNFKDEKGFRNTSEKYGKRAVWISGVVVAGGILLGAYNYLLRLINGIQ